MFSDSYNIRQVKQLNLYPWALFLIWSIWLAFPFFGLGPYSYVPILDVGNSGLPAKLAIPSLLSAGQIGYWFFQGVAGVDILASGIDFVFQLENLPFLFLPGWLAFGLVMVLQRFMAGYFTYRLLKESLGLSASACLFAGLAYAFYFPFAEYDGRLGGFTLYDGFGLPGLPFILWALTRLGEKPTYRSFLGAAGLGLLLSLSYLYAFSIFLFPVVLFWFIFITLKKRPAFWVMILLFCLIWLLSELPTLWASFLNAPLSGRWDWDPHKIYSLRCHIIEACRQLKLHLLPLGLALTGLFLTRGRERRLILLLSAVFFCFLWYAVYPFLLRLSADYLGPLKSFNLKRFYQIAPFLAIVSAGMGLNIISREWRLSLTRNKSSPVDISLEKALIVAAIIVILSESASAHWKMLNGVVRGENFAAVYSHPDLQRLAKENRSQPPFRVATITNDRYLQHPFFALAYGLETVDGAINLYSERYQDFWREVIRPLTKTNQDALDFFDYKAKGRLVYLLSPIGDGSLPQNKVLSFEDTYDLELLSLANARYIISPVPLQTGNLASFSSNLDEKQLAWQDKNRLARMLGILRGESPGIPLYIYENLKALPRFFLVGKVRLFDGPSQVLAAMREADFDDLGSTAYLDRTDFSESTLKGLNRRGGKVNLITYTADKIILEAESKGPCLLIATNNFSPYWKAEVDGSNTTVFPVDHTFQAVYIGSGRHRVVLEYEPPYAIRFRA